MPLRLLEAFLPDTTNEDFKDLIGADAHAALWRAESTDAGLSVKMLLSVEQTEQILDTLEQRFADTEGFRVVLLSVEATLPRVQEKSPEEGEGEQASDEQNDGGASIDEDEDAQDDSENQDASTMRISREELYNDVVGSTKFNAVYVATVVLSALVAAVGLLQDSVAVIIGAMVIAPLLGPNVALALATTLGDLKLGRNALSTNLLGLTIALGASVLLGVILTVDPDVEAIASRTGVGFPDMALALASGSAGVLAFTGGTSVALVGVMVAVALMPPLVVCGLLFGAGYNDAAIGALLLVVTNVICVNLAGVVTFVVQGVRPRQWLEATKARQMTRWAFAVWLSLLGVLVAIVALSETRGLG